MSEQRTHSCNYGGDYDPKQAFEVFEHLSYLLLQRPKWRLGPHTLPPPSSPFGRLLRNVLRDLQALGYAEPLPSGGWLLLKIKRWRALLKCARECAQCKHKRWCPLATLFRKKGWRLPDTELIISIYG